MSKANVLITGASSGIGLETAVYLAEHGFRVFASMRNLSRRGKLEAEAARRNAQLEVLQLDVTDPESIRAALETVMAQGGSMDAVVNSAGGQIRGYFEDLSEDEIREIFETNVFGAMALARAALPHMRAARNGRIVLLGSIGGRIGGPATSAYCASKFALEGFAESLSAEVKPFGIRVSLVDPAIVKSEIWTENRRIARGALDPGSLYHPWFQELERLTDWAVGASTVRPVDVAKTVHAALTVRRPRLRYTVGRRARLLVMLRRLAPDTWFERLYFDLLTRRVTHPKTPEAD